MENEVIFCNACGIENKAGSNFCLDCGEELVALHPIQYEGGMVLTLLCWGCGGLITMYKDGGFLACEQCGLTHRVISGPGYLTLQPAPGQIVPLENDPAAEALTTEAEPQPAAAEAGDPEIPTAAPAADVDPAHLLSTKKDALIQEQNRLQTEINHSEHLIGEAKSDRKNGWILFAIAAVDLLLLWNFTGGYIVAPGYIVMLLAGLLFFAGGITRLILGNNKLERAGSAQELEAKKIKKEDLERQLAEFDIQAAGERFEELPHDGFSTPAAQTNARPES